MPNEQTSVPLFVANTVLTASQQNLSAGTGVPVFATTVTRDAAFGGSNKALAEGQLCYLSSTNVVQYYDGAAWATVGPATAGALTLISSTTIGTTVSSVTVSSAFSATYDNYLLMVTGGTSSADVALKLTLGSTTTGYYYGLIVLTYAGTSSVVGGANTTSYYAGEGAASSLILNCEVKNPFNTKTTSFNSTIGANRTDGYSLSGAGYLNNTTSYTAFTLTPASGTITGGTIRVYGYANS
jgi:hypothetical protein